MKRLPPGTIHFPLCVMLCLPCILSAKLIIGQNQFVLAKFCIRLRQCAFLVDCYSSSIAGSWLVNGCVVSGYLVVGISGWWITKSSHWCLLSLFVERMQCINLAIVQSDYT